ncbi:hypothetical protein C8R46DRAFT_592276 [Mycena filopes]|nr:hypothetical protein C8R46DRAFT_592276 [Mycena filopes]
MSTGRISSSLQLCLGFMSGVVPSGTASGPGAPLLDSNLLATLYYTMEIVAILLIGIGILPAIFSNLVSRTATWYSFMLSWLWYTVSNIILAGRPSSVEPPFSLCLFQAGLIYASPVFVCGTGLAFIIELYLRVRSAIYSFPVARSTVILLIVLPLLLNLAMFVEVIIYGLNNKSVVRRNPSHLYCHMETSFQTSLASGLVILQIIPTMIMEVVTGTTLYREHRKLRTLPIKPNSPFSVTLFVRMVAFTIIASIGLGIGALDLQSSSPDLQVSQIAAQAAVPICAALAFLTQMDIFKSWRSQNTASATRSVAGSYAV